MLQSAIDGTVNWMKYGFITTTVNSFDSEEKGRLIKY